MTRRRVKSKASKLEKTNPSGRVDVLSYLLTKRVVEKLEERYQLPGLWETMKETVAVDIQQLMTNKRVEVPPVVMPLLKKFGVVPADME